MGSYRGSGEQSRFATMRIAQHGRSQGDRKEGEPSYISSIGTEHTYRYRLPKFIDWLAKRKIFKEDVTPDLAIEFLEENRARYREKTLLGYRIAFNVCFDLNLPVVHSALPTVLAPRAYSDAQYNYLLEKANYDFGLSIQIADAGGLRAHELLTLGRQSDFSEDSRDWLPTRFAGRDDEVEYIVKGKGGLRRAIKIPDRLSQQIEARRYALPVTTRSREINYTSYYELPGGQAFSQKFTRLSKRLFGWSTGAHALRHRYAQRRMVELQKLGYSYYQALQILSQELGHFSITNTLMYLR